MTKGVLPSTVTTYAVVWVETDTQAVLFPVLLPSQLMRLCKKLSTKELKYIMNKCIKLKIIKPYENDCTWQELGKAVRDASYMTLQCENYALRRIYLDALKPKEERMNPKDLTNDIYRTLSQNLYKDLAGEAISQALRKAKSMWKLLGKDVMSNKKSLPNVKLGAPVILHNKSYKIQYDSESKSYHAEIKLFKTHMEKYRFDVLLESKKKDFSAEAILKRIVAGEIKQATAQISNKPGKDMMLIISYVVEQKEVELDQNRIMGIDLGIAKAAYYGFNFGPQRGFIDGGEIQAFRHKVYSRRKAIQNQYKYSNRHGHGRKRALKPVEFLRERETNFANTTNFRYAKFLVDQAVRNKCGTIQMEKLENMGKEESSRFLKTWTYYDLRQKIANKAAEYGIRFVEINPQYTSQRCSVCGHIHSDNRMSQSEFVCTNCGTELNADYNAAVNIATEGIEDIIKQKLDEIKEVA